MFDFNIMVPLAVVALTNFYKQIKDKDNEGALVIVVAVVIGLIAGLAKTDGLTVQSGITAALAAVGIHTVAKQVG